MAAYIVITKVRTRDQAALDRYSKQAPDFMAGHDATFLARFGPFEVLEGMGMEGVGIVRFPSVEAAKAWYDAPVYQEASRDRHQGGDYQFVIVEGVE